MNVKSVRIDPFEKCFSKLPKEIQDAANDIYEKWKTAGYKGFGFEKKHSPPNTYSIDCTDGYRALGEMDGDVIKWYWIGNHNDYSKKLRKK